MSIEPKPEYEKLPILHNSKGEPFFEYLLFPYYAQAFEILVERQAKYGRRISSTQGSTASSSSSGIRSSEPRRSSAGRSSTGASSSILWTRRRNASSGTRSSTSRITR